MASNERRPREGTEGAAIRCDMSLCKPKATPKEGSREFQFACPVCGKANGTATLRVDRDGRLRWLVGCWSAYCRAIPSGDWLRAAAAEVGAPNGGALLVGPDVWLRPTGRPRSGVERAAPLPSSSTVRSWALRLRRREPRLLRWAHTERGLNTTTLRRHRLGYDGAALTLPVYAAGELVNVRRRALATGAEPRYRGLAGRGAQLYPDVPATGPVLLCAGELDALVARQAGLPAVSTTCGATLPSYLAPALAGRRVAVAYDAGEDPTLSVGFLLAEGADAWPVTLPLDHGQDLTDWFVTHRRTARELRTLIRRTRTAA